MNGKNSYNKTMEEKWWWVIAVFIINTCTTDYKVQTKNEYNSYLKVQWDFMIQSFTIFFLKMMIVHGNVGKYMQLLTIFWNI
jgi:hypothetical protein